MKRLKKMEINGARHMNEHLTTKKNFLHQTNRCCTEVICNVNPTFKHLLASHLPDSHFYLEYTHQQRISTHFTDSKNEMFWDDDDDDDDDMNAMGFGF